MKNFPLIKIAIAFICGIALQEVLHIPFWGIFACISVLLVFAVIAVLRIKLSETSLFVIAVILTAGAGALSLANKEYKTPDEILDVERIKDVRIFGEISRIELIRNGEIRLLVETDSIEAGGTNINKRLELICSVKEMSLDSTRGLYNKLHIGNYISVSGNYDMGRDRRNPYEFDYRKYLQLNNIDGILYSYQINDLSIIDNKSDYFSNFIFTIRKSIDCQIKKLHNAEAAALIRGLVLGDKSEISYETRQEFINAGMAHILAVSGLHTAYILLIFTFLFSRFNIRLRIISTIAGLIFFLLITGGQPSVFRAVIMGTIILAAQLSGRSTNIYNSLALSAIIILVINPADLFNAGFQLSFAAVLSMAYFYNFFKERISVFNIKPVWIKKATLFILVSVSAQIGTIPLILIYFGKLSLISIIANIIAIPLAGVIVAIGILTIILSYISASAALVYASANELFTWLFLTTAHITGNIKYGYLQIRDFSIPDTLIYFSLIIPIFYLYNKFTNVRAKIIIICFMFANLIILTRLDDEDLLPENNLSIMMIDVGQGDSFLVKFPNGQTALIDAGNYSAYFDYGERIIYPLLNNLNIEKIDYAFVSHMDADHCGGFLSLVRHKAIDSLYKPPIDSLDVEDYIFEDFLQKNGIKFRYYPHGILNIGGVRIYSISDYNDFYLDKASRNDRSAILMLVYGKTSFLFTGDASTRVEKIMNKRYASFLDCDVLKASHHGSSTGTSEKFLDFVKPDYALISAGISNKFKHPSLKTVERLHAAGSEILRTDKSGAVLMRSDGKNLRIIDWKN